MSSAEGAAADGTLCATLMNDHAVVPPFVSVG
jgi:hypothetical protein